MSAGENLVLQQEVAELRRELIEIRRKLDRFYEDQRAVLRLMEKLNARRAARTGEGE